MYRSLGYFSIVSEATEVSMGVAVRAVQEIPQYQELGEVAISNTHA